MWELGLAIFIISILDVVLYISGLLFRLIVYRKTGKINLGINYNIILVVLVIIFMSMFLWG